jgi:hypothetical protein
MTVISSEPRITDEGFAATSLTRTPPSRIQDCRRDRLYSGNFSCRNASNLLPRSVSAALNSISCAPVALKGPAPDREAAIRGTENGRMYSGREGNRKGTACAAADSTSSGPVYRRSGVVSLRGCGNAGTGNTVGRSQRTDDNKTTSNRTSHSGMRRGRESGGTARGECAAKKSRSLDNRSALLIQIDAVNA